MGLLPSNLPLEGARIESLAPGRSPGELLYTIRVGTLGGLFSYDASLGRESRIQHGRERRISALSRPGPDGSFACSVPSANGSRHLALLRGDGYDEEEITEGDSIDEAPSWSQKGRALVFQSAGIARSREGYVAGIGPYTIQRLDLDTGRLEDLLRDDGHDLLHPRENEDGSLIFIRRSRRSGAVGSLRSLVGFMSIPFRLVQAVFQWLSFFTLRYTGRPLVTEEGRRVEGDAAREIAMWRRMMDLARSSREAQERERLVENASRSRLVHRSADGKETVLAARVLCFDVGKDGGVLFSTESGIFCLAPDGRRDTVVTGVHAEAVVSLS
jgi:hypothetical protein